MKDKKMHLEHLERVQSVGSVGSVGNLMTTGGGQSTTNAGTITTPYGEIAADEETFDIVLCLMFFNFVFTFFF